MKILLFSTQWPEYMIELANALNTYGNVTLMLPTNHRFTSKHTTFISKHINFVPFKVVFHKSIRDNFKMLFQIITSIWKVRPDIIHIQANGHRLFYWVAILKPFRTRIVNTIHDPIKHIGDELSLKFDDSTAIFWGKIFTKAYIVHGKSLKKELKKSYNIDYNIIHTIPHGHFGIYKKFQVNHRTTNPQSVLFFGRIWKYKGLQYFIEAGNKVIKSYPNSLFYIIGVGEDISHYKKMIKYPDNFIIINERVTIEKVGEYFEQSSIVILPYIEATQSGVIPVAYAYGKPVIASDVGALAEVIEDGETGFLIKSKNSQEIAKKIEFLFQNPGLVNQMKTNIELKIKNQLSWESIALKTYSLYQNTTR